MKVLHIIPDINGGGASKGAYRIHQAIQIQGVKSKLLILKTNPDSKTEKENVIHVNQGILGWAQRKTYKWLNRLEEKKYRGFSTQNPALHSFGFATRGLLSYINRCDADIIHLHWIINMLSIEEIGQITKPIVWTFADMWPICGGEHYVMDNSPQARFRVGYLENNRPDYETGPDFNRLAWERKLLAWKNKVFYIAPCSHWLADCTKESPIFKKSIVEAINYPLDIKRFKPCSQTESRAHFGLPANQSIILAGATDGVNTLYKGGDLLQAAIKRIANQGQHDMVIALFGQKKELTFENWGLPVINLGPIYDEDVLAKAYSAADLLVLPSRQEAFGQVGSEALACGTPVVAFNHGGPVDIIDHQKTGWLAKPFEPDDLARGISWILAAQKNGADFTTPSSQRATELFSYDIIGHKYRQLYEKILNASNELRSSIYSDE